MNVSVFRILSFVFVFSLLSTVSCKDKEGCTNPNAINYDSDAEKEDGSCKANGSLMFWIDDITFGILYNDLSVQQLNFYIDGKLEGVQDVTVFSENEPACETSFTYSREVPLSGGKWVDYKVLDEDDNEIWNDEVVIPADQCNKLQLVYIP